MIPTSGEVSNNITVQNSETTTKHTTRTSDNVDVFIGSETIATVPSQQPHPMVAALEAARHGVAAGYGGPFGSCIVQGKRIIAVACNTVLRDQDPTCHAEINCIRDACKALGTYDLSDCELFTTSEPCPMCWGACKWARVLKISIGARRSVAAKYGFDDSAFYEELSRPIEQRRLAVVQRLPSVEGLDFRYLFEQSPTYQVRLKAGDFFLDSVFASYFRDSPPRESCLDSATPQVSSHQAPGCEVTAATTLDEGANRHTAFARAAVETALLGMSVGGSKQREPFAAVVVHDGAIVAKAYNTVVKDQDATATAEINAIRQACKVLGTHLLKNCNMYCTAEPDLMSLCAIFWARIPSVYVGLSQVQAARYGFEDGLIHLKELEATKWATVNSGCDTTFLEACEQLFKQWAAKTDAVLY